MRNNEVPLEAVLKYIKKSRDEYKEKLETLIPYAKSLEERLSSLTEEYEALKQAFEENKVSKAELGLVKCIKNENDAMRAELSSFRKDYKATQWYKQMKEDRNKVYEQNKKLRSAFESLIANRCNKSACDMCRELLEK